MLLWSQAPGKHSQAPQLTSLMSSSSVGKGVLPPMITTNNHVCSCKLQPLHVAVTTTYQQREEREVILKSTYSNLKCFKTLYHIILGWKY